MLGIIIAPWIIPAAATAISAVGAERTNRVNQREAAKNRKFQGQQALRQMRFQERMRNTSWQAGVADMEAAGLNPALAYSQGGAATPGGSAGGGATAAAAVDPTSSARDALMMSKQLKLTNQRIRKSKHEADSAAANAKLDELTADIMTDRPSRPAADGSMGIEHSGPSLLKRQLLAKVESGEMGVSSARAAMRFTDAKRRIADPMADIADALGPLLPILGGLGAAAGPASNLIRSIRGRRLFRGRGKGRKGIGLDEKSRAKREGIHP